MFQVTVTPDKGNSYQVDVKQRDVLKWERNTGGNILLAQQNGMRLADLYELTYHAAVREGQFTGTQEKFEESNELDFEEADDSPNLK